MPAKNTVSSDRNKGQKISPESLKKIRLDASAAWDKASSGRLREPAISPCVKLQSKEYIGFSFASSGMTLKQDI